MNSVQCMMLNEALGDDVLEYDEDGVLDWNEHADPRDRPGWWDHVEDGPYPEPTLQEVWKELLAQAARGYVHPQTVIFAYELSQAPE